MLPATEGQVTAEKPDRNAKLPANAPEQVRAQLDRLLSSSVFRTSPRLSAFLEHVVERQLEGKAEELGEFAIAHDVFGRDSSFDSKVDSIVRVSARKLRAKLEAYYAGPGAGDPVRIELPSPGYVPVFVATETPISGRGYKRAVLGALILLIASAVAVFSWLQTGTTPTAADKPILAVLPLRTLTSDPADVSIGEAMTAEIINALARSGGVTVIAPPRPDDPSVSRQIAVHLLLEGVVVRFEDRVRLTARIASVHDQRLIWGESFQSEMSDPLDAHRKLANDVARSIQAGLADRGEQGGRAIAESARTVPQAYVLGKAHMNRWTADGMQRSAAYFEQAIEEDSNFAPAHASHAMALRILSFMAPSPDRDLLARARRSAERALEIDDALAEAHASLAGSAAFERDWESAERHFRQAMRLDPDYGTAHHMYGMLCLAPSGRLDEAERALRRAIELDPLSLWSQLGLVPVLHYSGQSAAAMAQLEVVRELAPQLPILHRFRGQVHLALGEPRAAVAEFEQAHSRMHSPVDLGLLAHARAVAGERNEATELTRRLEKQLAEGGGSPWGLAVAYMGLGENDRALDQLLSASKDGEVWALYAAVDPLFRSLGNEPGFEEVLAELDLPEV